MTDRVELQPYNDDYPRQFAEEKARLEAVLGDAVLGIEHIGSTSVPGLAGKPLLDMIVAVRQIADADTLGPALEQLGYQYHPFFEETYPDRRFWLRRNAEGKRTHHIHLVELGSEYWEDHRLFRDFLRAHPEEAQAYMEHKLDLAARFADQREQYTRTKSKYVEALLQRARAQQQQQ